MPGGALEEIWNSMATLALVGNAPSSGSTFLSDLLDCSPLSASGPELNLFSNPRLYDFQDYKRVPWQPGSSASVYAARNCIYPGELPAYGLDRAGFEKLVAECDSLDMFLSRFAERYLALRGKSLAATVFEKTPQNINAISHFLAAQTNSWFVFALRNPVHVYASLLKRGFPRYIALITWLIDVAQYLPYRNHPRVITVRYEELVKEPFKVVSGILETTCGLTGLEEVAFMEQFRHNPYTQIYSGRVETWSVKDRGVVKDANRKSLSPELLADFAASLALELNPAYGRTYGFPAADFATALEQTGYTQTVTDMLEGIRPNMEAARPDGAAKRMLWKKVIYSLTADRERQASMDGLLHPVRVRQTLPNP